VSEQLRRDVVWFSQAGESNQAGQALYHFFSYASTSGDKKNRHF